MVWLACSTVLLVVGGFVLGAAAAGYRRRGHRAWVVLGWAGVGLVLTTVGAAGCPVLADSPVGLLLRAGLALLGGIAGWLTGTD